MKTFEMLFDDERTFYDALSTFYYEKNGLETSIAFLEYVLENLKRIKEGKNDK